MGTEANWPYKAGEKDRNRVRAFERDSGIIYLEYWEHGERKRISTGHRDRQKAKQQADELAAKFACGLPDEDSGITLRELFDRYRKRRASQLSGERQRYYRQMADLFCRYFGPEREAASLNREDWDAFTEDRRSGAIDARGRKVAEPERRPLRRNTVKKNLKALRAVLNWGVQADLLEVNPTMGYPFPKEDNPRRPRITQERYEAMIEIAGEVDWRAELALVLANETGHRIGAIIRLRWSDVDLAEGLVRWRAAGDKNRHEHVTPLTETAIEALRGAREERPAVGETWVFPAPEAASQPCSRHLMRDWWYRMEELAELEHEKGLGWHGLRRKFADEHRDASPKEIADLGGWKTPRTVIEVYQGSDLGAMRRAQRKRRRGSERAAEGQ